VITLATICQLLEVGADTYALDLKVWVEGDRIVLETPTHVYTLTLKGGL